MSIAKPAGAGRKEEVRLDSAASHLLEECRMVLPGTQALFGFQLIAVFSDGFEHKLALVERQLHFLALFLVALSAALVMAPAAIHRQSQLREVSERLIWLSSRLLRMSMYPLALGLTLDVYLIARVVFGTALIGLVFAAILFVALVILWLVLPRREAKENRSFAVRWPPLGRGAMQRAWCFIRILLVANALALAGWEASAQDATHVLNYTPPQNVFRQAIDPAEDYSFNGANASVQVYQFRRFQGNIQQAFQATLLREWIAVMHQEENVAGKPTFQKVNVPGADVAITASFAENRVGLARPHLRMLIIAGADAAIVDASAGTVQSWQQVVPALNQMAGTLRVETVKAPAALTPAAGNAVAGLYMGRKPKYTATMQNVTGYASYQNALHFYLFSPDGRVYRAYDQLQVPGGAISRFDFDAAERRDPMNSGRYTVDNGKLIIKMRGSPQETIAAAAPREGKVTINTVTYERQ